MALSVRKRRMQYNQTILHTIMDERLRKGRGGCLVLNALAPGRSLDSRLRVVCYE